jgi:hypothetical protein
MRSKNKEKRTEVEGNQLQSQKYVSQSSNKNEIDIE